MNQKLKELKEAIENSSIEYEYVAVYKDKFVLIYHVAHDEFTYEITVKDDSTQKLLEWLLRAIANSIAWKKF